MNKAIVWRRKAQSGAALLVVLVFILVSSLASSSLVVAYQTKLQREKEEQLLFAGAQIRKAILSYYATIPPGGARTLPASLEVLVNDHRFPKPVQHLRRIYADPMTGLPDWELIQGPGGIIGVKSRSPVRPMKRSGFPKEYAHFQERAAYLEWTFVITPP